MSDIDYTPLYRHRNSYERRVFVQGVRLGSALVTVQCLPENTEAAVVAMKNTELDGEPLLDTITWNQRQLIKEIERSADTKGPRKYLLERQYQLSEIYDARSKLWLVVDSRNVEKAAGVWVSDEDAIANQMAEFAEWDKKTAEMQSTEDQQRHEQAMRNVEQLKVINNFIQTADRAVQKLYISSEELTALESPRIDEALVILTMMTRELFIAKDAYESLHHSLSCDLPCKPGVLNVVDEEDTGEVVE